VTETIHLQKEELKGWGTKVKSKGARKRVEGEGLDNLDALGCAHVEVSADEY